MACPYAAQIRGAIAFCRLLNAKVSTLKYPCKGRYQRCPIYRARAPRAPAEAGPTAEAPSTASTGGRPAKEVRPQEPPALRATADQARAAEEAGRAEAGEGKAEAAATQPEQGRAQPAQSAPAQADTAGVKGAEEAEAWRSGSLVNHVCDPLIQAYAVAFAESNSYFTGSLRELLNLSKDYEDKAIYFDGRIGEREVKIIVYRGLMVGIQASNPEGSPLCGEDAARDVNPATRLSGMVYIVSVSALGTLGEALKGIMAG